MLINRLKTALLSAAILACAATTAHAASITLDATHRGWYNSNGDVLSDNYIAGSLFGAEYRDYFRFDLSAMTETVISATLRLFTGEASGTETYEVNQYSGSIASLIAGTGGLAAFADLGDGVALGSVTIGTADDYTFIDIALNGAALALIDAAGSAIAFGGAVTTLGFGDEYVFGFTGGGFPEDSQLILETSGIPLPPVAGVPEPGTLGLILGGLGMLGWRLRRRA
jgi:hypothetical protein